MGGRSAAAAARAAAWARLFPVALLGAVALIVCDEEGAEADELYRVDQSEVDMLLRRPVDEEAENEAWKPSSKLTFTFKNLGQSGQWPYFNGDLGRKDWGELLDALKAHPNHLQKVEDQVDLVFTGVGKHHLEKLLALPERDPTTPYVVIEHGLVVSNDCLKDFRPPLRDMVTCIDNSMVQRLRARHDIVFLSFDMRDPNLADDTWEPLRGVTVAPPAYFSGSKPDQSKLDSYQYLLSFRGSARASWLGVSTVRPSLKQSFASVKDSQIAVEFVKQHDFHKKISRKDKDAYNHILENSAFALVPHGDGRWNYRFSEVVGACDIPVVLADGLTLPYSELIDWKEASLQLDESVANNAQHVIDSVMQLKDNVGHMRSNVCDLNEKYFASGKKRAEATLLSLEKLLRQGAGVAEAGVDGGVQ